MAKVILKNINKVYDKDVVAVQDFNLEINDQEFVVLVGPSGCGKSTTLRMIAGLEEITNGELYIGDQLVNDISAKDRNIAMVFQNYALYPHMTVYENMAFSLRLRKLKKIEIEKKVKETAEILEITDLLQRKPKALSGGQRQRVAIGRAIVRHPKVFLMDEPLSNLDAKLRNMMRAEIIKLRGRINTTFIYVTHDQIEAMTLGDRIVIMKDGVIQQIGTPQAVYEHPRNIFVAGFIGTPQMNFFDVRLTSAHNRFEIHLGESVIKLSEDTQKALRGGKYVAQNVVLGIRPEHITITDSDSAHAIPVIVEFSEMMGNEIYLHIVVAGRNGIVRIPTAGLPVAHYKQLISGETIKVTFNENFIYLFDADNERNVLS
jgi:multiple sugar transport system ATP-binding protein